MAKCPLTIQNNRISKQTTTMANYDQFRATEIINLLDEVKVTIETTIDLSNDDDETEPQPTANPYDVVQQVVADKTRQWILGESKDIVPLPDKPSNRIKLSKLKLIQHFPTLVHILNHTTQDTLRRVTDEDAQANKGLQKLLYEYKYLSRWEKQTLDRLCKLQEDINSCNTFDGAKVALLETEQVLKRYRRNFLRYHDVFVPQVHAFLRDHVTYTSVRPSHLYDENVQDLLEQLDELQTEFDTVQDLYKRYNGIARK